MVPVPTVRGAIGLATEIRTSWVIAWPFDSFGHNTLQHTTASFTELGYRFVYITAHTFYTRVSVFPLTKGTASII